MSAFTNMLAAIGGIGNAAGVQGDGPGGLNALQRAALSPEETDSYNQQSALAQLAKNQSYLNGTDADQAKMIAGVTGTLANTQNAGALAQINNTSLKDPALLDKAFQSSAVADRLGKFAPIMQQMNLTNSSNQQYDSQGNHVSQQPQITTGAQLPVGHPLNAATYIPTLTKWESGNNPQAIGDNGNAIGLGQLHAAAAIDAGIDPKDRADPVKNLQGTTVYLQQQLDRFKDPYTALLAYNQGPTFAQGWVKDGSNIQNLPPNVAAYPANASGGKITAPIGSQVSSPNNQDSNYNPPKLSDKTQDMFTQAGVMAKQPTKSDNSRAQVQLAEAQPDYVAQKSYTENYYKNKGEIGQKEAANNINYENDINTDASSALKTQTTLAKMSNYLQNFTPSKALGVQKAIAQYKVAGGLANPNDVKLAATTEGFDKLAYQLASQSVKQISSKGTNLDLNTELQSNPNSSMTPEGAKSIVDFMRQTSDLPLQKQQEFQNWKKTNNSGHYPDFEPVWNAKQQANIPAMTANISAQPNSNAQAAPNPMQWNTTKSGLKYGFIPK